MKISEKLNMAINLQITHELINAMKYSIIASYFEDLQLKNLAKKFWLQKSEELEHHQKFINHLNDRLGGKYINQEVPQIELQINSISDIATLYLETELETTESISEILNIIREEKSFQDEPLFLEFMSIQNIEEDEADEFQKRVSYTKDLLILDHVYGGG